MGMVHLIHYTENSILFFQFNTYIPTARCLLLRPRERLRSIAMSNAVCVSVCPRHFGNHTRDLYQFFVHVAYVRGSVIMRHVDDRPHHLSAEEGDGSAQNVRSVIYDRLVVSVLNVGEGSLFQTQEVNLKLTYKPYSNVNDLFDVDRKHFACSKRELHCLKNYVATSCIVL